MNRLYRSNYDRKITGLCGGIAAWLGIDATLVRLIVAIAAFFSAGSVILIYLIAGLIVPKAPY
jgi:phage shock protein C